MTYKDELEVRLRRAENVLDRAKKRVKKWRRKLIRARAAHLYARQEVRRIRRELEAEIANIADVAACINETSESAPSSPTPSCVEPKPCTVCGTRGPGMARYLFPGDILKWSCRACHIGAFPPASPPPARPIEPRPCDVCGYKHLIRDWHPSTTGLRWACEYCADKLGFVPTSPITETGPGGPGSQV